MRFSKYSLPVEVEEGYILYNSFFSRFVNIFNEPELSEIKQIISTGIINQESRMVQTLYNMGFFVDDNADEYATAKKYVEDCYKLSEQNLVILLYVTENCNFNCVYCPQIHEPKVFPDAKWEGLYKYIEKSLQNNLYKKISVDFFGGEPLLEIKNIFKFMDKCEHLKELYPQVTFNYTMTTNAYLLTKDIYDKLVKHGLTYLQITVDGFAETHNKMRPRRDDAETWNQIIENLKYINSQNDDVKVALRTNYNDTNYNSIEEFAEWINETFDNKKFSITLHPVSKFSDNVNEEQLGKNDSKEANLLIKKYNRYAYSPNIELRNFGKTCKCANKNNYTISVTGDISKCEQAYNENGLGIGYLSDDGDFVLDEELFKAWTSDFEIEECANCFIYPLCAARACPSLKVSTPKNPGCAAKDKDVKADIIRHIQLGYLKTK